MDRRFFLTLGVAILVVSGLTVWGYNSGDLQGRIAAAEGAIPSGAELFMIHGCTACHLIAGTGFTVGPNLKGVGKRLTDEQIRQSILDPNAVITKGFLPNLMPPDMKDKITPPELDALVKYLKGL